MGGVENEGVERDSWHPIDVVTYIDRVHVHLHGIVTMSVLFVCVFLGTRQSTKMKKEKRYCIVAIYVYRMRTHMDAMECVESC